MAGQLADFSRRPLSFKAGVFAGIGALIGLLYWQFAYQPLKKARDAAENDYEAQKADGAKLKRDKQEYDKLLTRQTELKINIEQNQKALPTEAEMPAFFDMLARKTGEAGVEAVKRTVTKEVAIENFIKVPVDIEVSGTFYQLKKFFASLRAQHGKTSTSPDATEEKDRIVTIENLTINDPKVKDNEIILTAHFTAATFRTAPVAPVPDAKGGDKPGAKPGDKPATPAPPPGKRNLQGLGDKAEAGAAAGDTRAGKATDDADQPKGGR